MHKLLDTLNGLYLRADLHRGEPQFALLDDGLAVGLAINSDGLTHRLQISRLGTTPTEDEWEIVLKGMPYGLAAESEERACGDLHVLEATYSVVRCLCGWPRVLYEDDYLEACRRCGGAALILRTAPDISVEEVSG